MSFGLQAYGIQAMLKEGHKHLSGLDEAVLKNIDACKQLSDITRTSLGPNAPQSEAAVMSSAGQKWRDFKNKLNSRFVWPYRDNSEKLRSPPKQYQIPSAIWKAFVDERLHPSWELAYFKYCWSPVSLLQVLLDFTQPELTSGIFF
ncbi:hypothetical protein ZIOFF_043420 [Zingiber officinale]|uniref:Uncharacterized protein n=1 Tax=Zingiber officinale TaxID=94328 RepID=A0A8J5KTZ5_ZINOF|nr:hypothetical protein ZIOFF_043420 [Zingiber officinale]